MSFKHALEHKLSMFFYDNAKLRKKARHLDYALKDIDQTLGKLSLKKK